MTTITTTKKEVLKVGTVNSSTLNFGTTVRNGKLTGFIEADLHITLYSPSEGYQVSLRTQYEYKSADNVSIALEDAVKAIADNSARVDGNDFIFNTDGHLVANSVADERAYGYCVENLQFKFANSESYKQFVEHHNFSDDMSYDTEFGWFDDVDQASNVLSSLLHDNDSLELRKAIHSELADKIIPF